MSGDGYMLVDIEIDITGNDEYGWALPRELDPAWAITQGRALSADGEDVTVSAAYPYDISLLGFVVKSGDLTSTTTERVE